MGTLPIEDGQTPPPVVGELGRFPLIFSEAGPGEDDTPDATVSTWRVRAEPDNDGKPRGPGRRWDGTPNDRPPLWPTTLHGDGWTANWSAPRPVTGQVELRGTLIGDLGISSQQWVRGRVTRARVVTETIDTSDPDQTRWRPIPARQTLREVEVAPRWFDHGLVAPPDAPATGWYSPVPGDPYVVETGVLIELDLDDAPPLPLRPAIVPAAVAAHGQDLWVTDTRLPLVVQVRRPLSEQPQITGYPWPGRILDPGRSERRSVHADRDGVWITGPDGTHRINHEGSDLGVNALGVNGLGVNGLGVNGLEGTVRLVDEEPVWLLATANRGVLLAVVDLEPGDPHTPLALRLLTPGGDRSNVELGDRSVAAAAANRAGDGSGFVLLLRHRDHPPGPDSPGGQADTRPWLGRLTAVGELLEGPYLDLARPSRLHLLAGDPALVLDQRNGGLHQVRADLTLADGIALWAHVLRAYAADGRLWVATHPPHPDDIRRRGTEACWPLPAPPEYPEDRQYWLLTELDPATFAPQVATLVPRVPDDLTVDGDGTVWIQADGIRRVPGTHGAAAELLDIAELLNAATTAAAGGTSGPEARPNEPGAS